MSDNTNIAISYGGYQPSNPAALDAIFAARGGRQAGGAPITFLTQPTVAPASGTAGQTFTATPGTLSSGSITAREWRLAGTVVSTALTYVSTAAGALTYQEFAGAVASNLIAVTVTAALPTLPAGAVYRLSAESITPQTSGTALATDWVDQINGATAARAVGFEPKYMTGGMNGRPFLRFDGTTAKGLNAGRPAALTAAIDGQNYTVLLVVKNVVATTYGVAFAAGSGGALLVGANATVAGFASGGSYVRTGLPWAGSDLANRLIIAAVTDPTGFPGGGRLSRAYLNSTCVGADNDFPTSGGGNFGIGGTFDGGFFGAFDLYDVVVWNRALTQIEIMKAQMYFDSLSGQAYPWTAASKFTIMMGSSLVADTNASEKQYGLSYRTAQLLSQPIGTWTNLGIGGCAVDGLTTDMNTNVIPIPALIGKPCRASWQEWYNSRADTAILTKSQSVISNLKTAGIKIAWSSAAAFSSDHTDGSPVTRATYNQASNWTSADTYINFSTDANIGVDGAVPIGGNTYYKSDGLHWTGIAGTCGDSVAATYFANGLALL